jgi:hypothetical protein
MKRSVIELLNAQRTWRIVARATVAEATTRLTDLRDALGQRGRERNNAHLLAQPAATANDTDMIGLGETRDRKVEMARAVPGLNLGVSTMLPAGFAHRGAGGGTGALTASWATPTG